MKTRIGMTKKEATTLGTALLRKMDSRNWKLYVWENFGWHYCISNPPLSIYEHENEYTGKRYFSILMSDHQNKARAGSYLWKLYGDCKYRNPNSLVKAQVRLAKRSIDLLNNVVKKAEEIANDETGKK